MKKIKLMIVDDVEGIREYFSSILSHEADMEVVATAQSGRAAIEVYKKTKCDVILMDIEMETRTAGIEAIEAIKKIDDQVKIIVITIHEDEELIFKAYTAGAVDFIIKTDSIAEVVTSIRKINSNKIELRPQIAEKILSEFKKLRSEQQSLLFVINIVTKLSNSEFDVLKSVYYGKSYTEIAKDRFVEIATIKKQVSNILKKFNSSSMKSVIKILKEINFFEKCL